MDELTTAASAFGPIRLRQRVASTPVAIHRQIVLAPVAFGKESPAKNPPSTIHSLSDPTPDELEDLFLSWHAAPHGQTQSSIMNFQNGDDGILETLELIDRQLNDRGEPPSLTVLTPERDTLIRRRFNRLGYDVSNDELVWRAINETIGYIREHCTIQQKRRLWTTFQQSISIPTIIWKRDAIYYINQAYSDVTGFPEGDPGETLTMFDLVRPSLLAATRAVVAQIYLDGHIKKYQMMDQPLIKRDGTTIRCSFICTVKRDVFGFLEYLVGHCIFGTTENTGTVIIAPDGKSVFFKDRNIEIKGV
ncbi:hypothetical protein PROFUN_06946 [Planoprotostelium fungivorum]|uniref:PAS domain-containing protein n=1 Tax=Planoprotostelium fungivorum TaxID=1890364 RepID=A0A2P6NN55_9EUKA|nr:hypothetical protein PROFUN_06946 [Planoprotostelium fungivorum]